MRATKVSCLTLLSNPRPRTVASDATSYFRDRTVSLTDPAHLDKRLPLVCQPVNLFQEIIYEVFQPLLLVRYPS